MPSAVIYGKPGEQFQTDQYKRHNFGTKMYINDRVYVYAQMGGTAGVAGKLYQSEVPTAHWNTVTADTARAAGATAISATIGATATVQDEFDEGYIVIEDDAGEGHMYHVGRAWKPGDASAATSSSGIQTINLISGESVQVAITTSTTMSFFKNKLDEVIIHLSPPTAAVVGLAVAAVTANYYCWLQTHGPAAVLCDGTLVAGKGVRASEDDDGAVAALDVSDDRDEPLLGSVIDIGADTEFATINLQIP